jgi:SLOG in TRPM, prokaryote
MAPSAERGSGMNEQAGGDSAPHIRISSTDEIAKALDRAGLRRGRMVVVVVGGAGRMAENDFDAAAEVLRKEVLPIVELRDAVVIDGGTDSRAQSGGRFPLVGVAAEGTVVGPDGESASPDAAGLEPNHTLFLIVPGSRWGDEAPWIADVATAVAGDRTSVTLLVNGGQVAYTDVTRSLDRGRPVVVLAGSGRTADAIARARAGHGGEALAVDIAASPLTRVVDIREAGAVAAAIETILDGG